MKSDIVQYMVLIRNPDTTLDKTGLYELFFEIAKDYISQEELIEVNGKRWPRDVSFVKAKTLLEKRRGNDLKAIWAYSQNGDFCVALETSFSPYDEFCISSCLENWRPEMLTAVENMLGLFEARFGFFARHRGKPNCTACRNLFRDGMDRQMRLYDVIRALNDVATSKQKWGAEWRGSRADRSVKFDSFFVIPPLSVVTSVHLGIEVSPSLKLQDWIGQETYRGQLRPANSVNWIWEIDEAHLENVNRELWGTPVMPMSEHFKIVGWDSAILAPLLETYPSIMEVRELANLKDIAFVDGVVPQAVTDYFAQFKNS